MWRRRMWMWWVKRRPGVMSELLRLHLRAACLLNQNWEQLDGDIHNLESLHRRHGRLMC